MKAKDLSGDDFETKVIGISIETLSEGDGSFSGLAIPFDSLHDTSSWQLDGWQDNVLFGSFADTLAEHKAAGTMPLLQWMHERGNIVGTITSAKETPAGVKVEGKVSPRAISPSGVPVLELLRTNAVGGLSIGFRPTQWRLDEKNKVRTIENLEWRELSVVDVAGAGPEARVTDVKRDPRSLEALLRGHGLSRREAKQLLAGGLTSIEKDPPPPPVPVPESEELAATKVSRLAAADSAAAHASSADAGTAHGAATVAHAQAAADHVAAAHSNSLAATQAADKGDAAAATEFKATADAHTSKAGLHNIAATAMQSCYQSMAAPSDPPAVVPATSPPPSEASVVGEVKALAEEIKNWLSQRDADGALRDATGSIAESVSDFTNQIRRSI